MQLEGLGNEHSLFQALSHWMNLNSLAQYCQEMLSWPNIGTHFDIIWDTESQSIK
jgi:hypothetical protein